MEELSADLGGRVALITGGGKNIGRMMAIKMARSGAKVGITYQTNKEGALETCDFIAKEGGTCVALQVELTDPGSIHNCVDEFEEAVGAPIDIFVNNASIRPPQRFNTLTVEHWDLAINTNARPLFIFTQKIVPSMMERGWGRVIYVSGVHAHMGARNPAVSASKLAGVGYILSLSKVAAPRGVTANVLIPGFVNTHHDNHEMYGPDSERQGAIKKIPIGRLSEPADVANACLFLVSNGASFMTGQEMWVTGGLPPHAD